MKRKRYSKELKSKVALAAIKGDRTINEIASEFGIHASQVNRWKKEAIGMLPELFGSKAARKAKDVEKEKDLLHRQIGKLQVGVEFLKKHGALALSVSEKRNCIEITHPHLSIQPSMGDYEKAYSGGAVRRRNKSMERPTHNNRARLVSPRYASGRSSRHYI